MLPIEARLPGDGLDVDAQIAWNFGIDPILVSESVYAAKESELPPLISKKTEKILNELLGELGYQKVEGCDHLIPPKRLVYPE